LGQDLFCNIGRLGQIVAAADAVILEPGDIQRIIALFNLLAGKAAETVRFTLVFTLGLGVWVAAIGGHKLFEMFYRQEGAFAETGHVGAQVIDPNLFGVGLVFFAAGEKEHVGFDSLGVKDAGGQAQNGVQVALVHEIGTDLLAVAVGKKWK